MSLTGLNFLQLFVLLLVWVSDLESSPEYLCNQAFFVNFPDAVGEARTSGRVWSGGLGALIVSLSVSIPFTTRLIVSAKDGMEFAAELIEVEDC